MHDIGSSVDLVCKLEERSSPYSLVWKRENGLIPTKAKQVGGNSSKLEKLLKLVKIHVL
jgi:hypothetical protein